MTKERINIYLTSKLITRLDKHRAETRQTRSEMIESWVNERLAKEEQAKEGDY